MRLSITPPTTPPLCYLGELTGTWQEFPPEDTGSRLWWFGGWSRSVQFKGHPLFNVYTRGSIQLIRKMVEEKRVLVKLGDSNRPLSRLMEKTIKMSWRNQENLSQWDLWKLFILQIKDEEWGREFLDISPSQTEIASKSILKVIVKKV